MLISARISKKSEEEQPEHVERSHACSEETNEPKKGVPLKRMPQDLVFAEKPGQRRDSCNRQRCGGEGLCRRRNLVPEAAHFLQILFPGHRVNDAASAEEQQRFEERMRHQVKDSRGESTHAQGEKHISKLADGGIRQH